MVVVESFHQLTSCVQSLAVNMPIVPHPVHCLVHILKMAAQEMAGLGSEDLLLDDKWLSSILGEEEQSVQVDKEKKLAVDKVDKEEELAADWILCLHPRICHARYFLRIFNCSLYKGSCNIDETK